MTALDKLLGEIETLSREDGPAAKARVHEKAMALVTIIRRQRETLEYYADAPVEEQPHEAKLALENVEELAKGVVER